MMPTVTNVLAAQSMISATIRRGQDAYSGTRRHYRPTGLSIVAACRAPVTSRKQSRYGGGTARTKVRVVSLAAKRCADSHHFHAVAPAAKEDECSRTAKS